MHNWDEEKFDWGGLNDAGDFIGEWLRKWARLEITQIKEKFGTLRIYCGFGWSNMYSIWRPQYMWMPTWWPTRLDRFLSWLILPTINKIVVPMQKRAYATRYALAVEKWPHLRHEILSCADWGELLEGVVPGYKHSDYWKEIK